MSWPATAAPAAPAAPAGPAGPAAPNVAPEADPPQAYGGSIPGGKATAGEVLLVWEMNGEPLPRAHGGPVRIVVPGPIGARSVKWVDTITARDRPSDNFSQVRAYRLLQPDAEDPQPGDGVALRAVALNSEILLPDDGTVLPPGPATVVGYASAGDDRTIVRVDVSADGGASWVEAELDEQVSRWAWRFWRTTVELGPARRRSSRAHGTAPRPFGPSTPPASGTRRATSTTRGRRSPSPVRPRAQARLRDTHA